MTPEKPKAFNPDALWVVMVRRQISAPQLARKLGKRTSKIKRYLCGINEPSEDDLIQFSKVMNWPVEFFYNTNVEIPSCPTL